MCSYPHNFCTTTATPCIARHVSQHCNFLIPSDITHISMHQIFNSHPKHPLYHHTPPPKPNFHGLTLYTLNTNLQFHTGCPITVAIFFYQLSIYSFNFCSFPWTYKQKQMNETCLLHVLMFSFSTSPISSTNLEGKVQLNLSAMIG